MLDDWVFAACACGLILIGLFHGCILLLAPDRYPPFFSWGKGQTLRLVRKPPLQLETRLAGLALSLMMLFIFLPPVVRWVLHPAFSQISSGESPLPRGFARWDELVFAICGVTAGIFLWFRAGELVTRAFHLDPSKPEDKITRRLWTVYYRVFGALLMAMSLLPATDFIRSLRA